MNINLEELTNQRRALSVEFGLNILAAIAILVIGVWIEKIIRKTIGKGSQ